MMRLRTSLQGPVCACRERMAQRVQQLGAKHPGDRLRWGGVKEFADGSLGSYTALMHEPYAGKVSDTESPGEAGFANSQDPGSASWAASLHQWQCPLLAHDLPWWCSLPCADNPASSGTRSIETEKLLGLVGKADAAGLQVRSWWPWACFVWAESWGAALHLLLAHSTSLLQAAGCPSSAVAA